MKNFLRKLVEVFFPSHCLYCEKIINKDSLFCGDCWLKLQFITDPKCKICSYPFEIEISHMSPLCSKCLIKKPSYDKSIVIFRYNPFIKKIIGDLKYRDKNFLAKKFAKILHEKIRSEIATYDLIVAVPLHQKRLRKRKFNQAVLLCRELLKFFPKKNFYPDFLIRVKNTKPQVELRKKEREKNLKRAFLVNKKYRDEVMGKKILLVDDVMTTGATLENCAKELKRRGAKEVVSLVVAKTVFGK
jgi:ComF family protein